MSGNFYIWVVYRGAEVGGKANAQGTFSTYGLARHKPKAEKPKELEFCQHTDKAIGQ